MPADDLDLAELRRVAEAAHEKQPGPWSRPSSQYGHKEDRITRAGHEHEWGSVLTGSPAGDCNTDLLGDDEVIDFAAAWSPSVALALLRRLEAAERVCRDLEPVMGTNDEPGHGETKDVRPALDAWRATRGKP